MSKTIGEHFVDWAAILSDIVQQAVIAERQACWDAIDQCIETGPLPQDKHERRNGLVLASNEIFKRGGVGRQ